MKRLSGKDKKKKEFDPKDYINDDLAESDVLAFKAAFDYIDSEGEGEITSQKLKDALSEIGDEINGRKIADLIKKIDDKGYDILDFEKFIDVIGGNPPNYETEEGCRQVFKEFSGDEDGSLDFRTFKKVVKEMGENATDEELKRMFEVADTDQDGRVGFEEFYCILNKKGSA